jgi:MFS family permease
VIAVSFFIWSILPIFWIVATPATAMFWLTISSILGGAGASAAVNASNKLITRVPPRSDRGMYIAMNACLSNLAGGLGPLVGGYFLQGLAGHHWSLWGREYVPFHLIFLASLVLRLASWLLVFRIKVPDFDHGK